MPPKGEQMKRKTIFWIIAALVVAGALGKLVWWFWFDVLMKNAY